MASPLWFERKIGELIEKMYSQVDSLFDSVVKMIVEGGSEEDYLVEEKTLAVEEMRSNIVRETLLYLARWQPLGRDLTRAEGFIMASYGLYRIARYLREIARLHKIAGPLRRGEVNVEMLEKSRAMVSLAVRYLLTGDPELSRRVMDADGEIDEYYERSLKELSRDRIPREKAIEALFARHVERIADHATYIAGLPMP